MAGESAELAGQHTQQMRGSGSPTSISITRVPPYAVLPGRSPRLFANLADDRGFVPAWRVSRERRAPLSAYSGATTARNWPSFAMCKRIEAEQFACAAHRIAHRNPLFEEHDPRPQSRASSFRSGHSAARGIAHPANARACRTRHRFDQRKHRARIGTDLAFEIEFAAREQNRDAVIADRAR